MITVAVIAHPQRATHARQLADEITASHISWDHETLGATHNHLAALHWHNSHPGEWAVTVEDDADPVPHFRTHIRKALTAAPAPIVSFYLGKTRPPQHQHRIQAATRQADTQHACWITDNHLMHAVAYAIRKELLPSLLEHRTPLPIDQHITNWAKKHHHPIAYTWPSLANHLDLPTIISNHHDDSFRPEGRHAWKTGQRPKWDTTTVPMPA